MDDGKTRGRVNVALVGVSIVMVKPCEQKQLGEERGLFISFTDLYYSSSLREVRAGSLRQKLKQKHEGVLLADLFPMACSACFLVEHAVGSAGSSHISRQSRKCIPEQSSGVVFSTEDPEQL